MEWLGSDNVLPLHKSLRRALFKTGRKRNQLRHRLVRAAPHLLMCVKLCFCGLKELMVHFVSSLVVVVENYVLYDDKEIIHD